MIEAVARLRVVAPPEVAVGFLVGGAIVHAADDAPGAAEIVRTLIDEGERGVIAVHEPWFDSFDQSERERLEESVAPVVVAMPSGLGADGGAARKARLASLLRRSIGYHITFEEGE
jgi:vacuolar-type H+-ATPase subunit F/Vma7